MIEDPEQRRAIEEVFMERIEDSRRYLAYSPQAPFTVGQAKGNHVYDAFNSEYLDFYCADGTAIFGHSDPSVVGPSLEHARHYHNTSDAQGAHLMWPVVEYAKQLASAFGRDNLQVEFATDEQSALREAVRIATEITGKRRILVVAGDNLWLARDYAERASTVMPGLFLSDLEWGEFGAVVISLMTRHGEPLNRQWAQHTIERARAMNVPVILNEARTGFGRTGHLWGQQFWGVQPDFTVLAGPGGGSFPFGAVVAEEKWFAAAKNVPSLPALSGDSVVCRVGMSVLEHLDKDLLKQVEESGIELANGLQELSDQFPLHVTSHWGLGLWQAIVLSDEAVARRFVRECLGKGLIVAPPRGPVVSFFPALNIDNTTLRQGLDLMAAVLMDLGPPKE